MRTVRTRLLRLFKIVAVAGLVSGMVRALRRRRAPQVTGEARWPPLAEEPSPTPRRGPVTFDESPAASAGDDAPGWVEPVDGACPSSHPIKGNLSRNNVLIFHLPGTNNYERTKPEACFATEADAEAAGFRKARS